jgi:hypothetical protein
MNYRQAACGLPSVSSYGQILTLRVFVWSISDPIQQNAGVSHFNKFDGLLCSNVSA